MKPAQDWRAELNSVTPGADVALMEGRGGDPTLKVGSVFLHSRYRPVEEAARLIESAELDLERPVLVVGLGLGYHVLELLKRGADVAVVEPDIPLAMPGALYTTKCSPNSITLPKPCPCAIRHHPDFMKPKSFKTLSVQSASSSRLMSSGLNQAQSANSLLSTAGSPVLVARNVLHTCS